MKTPRSEAVDKSPGVFFDPEYDSEAPGTPGAIKQAEKQIFPKIQKFQKIAKKIPKPRLRKLQIVTEALYVQSVTRLCGFRTCKKPICNSNK